MSIAASLTMMRGTTIGRLKRPARGTTIATSRATTNGFFDAAHGAFAMKTSCRRMVGASEKPKSTASAPIRTSRPDSLARWRSSGPRSQFQSNATTIAVAPSSATSVIAMRLRHGCVRAKIIAIPLRSCGSLPGRSKLHSIVWR